MSKRPKKHKRMPHSQRKRGRRNTLVDLCRECHGSGWKLSGDIDENGPYTKLEPCDCPAGPHAKRFAYSMLGFVIGGLFADMIDPKKDKP